MEKGMCELCGRTPVELTIHHLIPKEEGGAFSPTAKLCQPCHKHIHFTFTNAELAQVYHTVKRLQDHASIKKYIHWIRKQPADTVPRMKKSNRLKKGGA